MGDPEVESNQAGNETTDTKETILKFSFWILSYEGPPKTLREIIIGFLSGFLAILFILLFILNTAVDRPQFTSPVVGYLVEKQPTILESYLEDSVNATVTAFPTPPAKVTVFVTHEPPVTTEIEVRVPELVTQIVSVEVTREVTRLVNLVVTATPTPTPSPPEIIVNTLPEMFDSAERVLETRNLALLSTGWAGFGKRRLVDEIENILNVFSDIENLSWDIDGSVSDPRALTNYPDTYDLDIVTTKLIIGGNYRCSGQRGGNYERRAELEYIAKMRIEVQKYLVDDELTEVPTIISWEPITDPLSVFCDERRSSDTATPTQSSN